MKNTTWSKCIRLSAAWCLLAASSAFAVESTGSVLFNTRVVGVVDAKVSRPDGTGAGAGIKAQLFLVGSGGVLTPLTPATTFRTVNAEAAYYVQPVTIDVTGRPPGEPATLRMRAWNGTAYDGSSLRGESADFTVVLGGGLLPPAGLTGLTSFSLIGQTVPTITVAALAGANGSISPSGTINKPKGESASFTAKPNAGFVVDKWSVNGVAAQTGGASFTLSNLQENRAVLVTFKQEAIATVTIIAAAGLNGTISPSGIFTKGKGQDQLFTATPRSGYAVDKWSVNGASAQTGGATFTLSNLQENRAVLVTFKRMEDATVTITATAGANGSISPSGTINKTKGQSQSFTATPASGYIVEKWSVNGAVVQTGGTGFTLSNIQENRAVNVTFVKQAGAADGAVNFNNYVAGVVNAKVARPDGNGAGAGAKAQLLLVGTDGKLTPLLPITTFRDSSPEAAFYVNAVEVSLPGTEPGKEAKLRMRAWVGESYNAAKLRGESKDFVVVLGGGLIPPANLVSLEGFALAAPTVDALPFIVEQPKSVNAHPGSIASFGVKAVGSGPLSYQWKRNGQAIEGATGATLTLKNVKSDDEGKYVVVVSNSIGYTTSAEARLIVKKKRASDDFDDDGNPDILLIHANRTVAFWFMDGVKIREGRTPFKVEEGWEIVATGDFNNDGKTDMLLQGRARSLAFWFMDGTSITKGLISMRVPEGWQIAATGDFNNDDQTDILLQGADGALAFWIMDGTTVAKVVDASFKVPEGWQLLGAGDFNKDGETDILLRHSNRSLAFWFMEGTTIKNGLVPVRVPEGWQVVGLGDFNQDGQTDIMLRHDDRWIAFWFMDGANISSGVVPFREPEGWRVLGRR